MVGKQSYKAVILPYMLTIRQSTVDLLKQFAASGGRIIALEMPAYIEGMKDAEKLGELERIITLTDADEFPEILQKEVNPEVIVSGKILKMYG